MLANLATAGVSILLFLGVAELAARWDRSRAGFKDDATQQYMQFDPLLGWRKTAGAHATYRRPEYTVEVQINSQGLRDPERPRVQDPGAFRLLALGDSFVEGYTVPVEQTTTQVLERGLRSRGCDAEVLNGGTSGYSTDQELLYWREEGIRLGAQVVSLFFYYNDVVLNDTDNYYGRRKPRFTVEDGTLRLTNVPLPEPPPAPDAPAETDSVSPLRLASYDWLRERLMRGAPAAYDGLATLGLWPRLKPEEPGLELRVYKRGPTPRVDGAWLITDYLLAALKSEVEATGARFFVVHAPNRMEIKDVDRELMARAYGMTDEGWSSSRVLERLQAIGKRRGFEVLDLAPAMRRHQGLLVSPYLRRDPHWNALGHRVAAEEVERFLEARGWLACETGRTARVGRGSP